MKRSWIGVLLGSAMLGWSTPALADALSTSATERQVQALHFAEPLTEAGRERLIDGRGLPVIVRLALPGSSQRSAGTPGVDDQERRVRIRDVQRQVLLETFGADLQRLQTRSRYARLDGADLLHVDESFAVFPGFSAILGRSEIEALQRHPLVEAVFEDRAMKPMLEESTALIGAPAMWSLGFDGAGGAVAILDTGVEKDHPMVGPAISASACFSSDVPGRSTSLCPDGSEEMTSLIGAAAGDACLDSLIDPENGTTGCTHGTHVASIAAGRSVGLSNGAQLGGVARGANIVAVNVFSRFSADDCEDEEGAHCARSYTSDQLRALEWLYDNRTILSLKSVNMSLGGGEYASPCLFNPVRTVIQRLLGEGIATVIASGNDGYADAVSEPACIPEAITVGATDKQDAVASFSNSSGGLDLLAPGVSILGALLTEEPAPGENCVINDADPGADGVCSWFSTKSGTSMAAPHVAGAFALLRMAAPSASVADILAALDFTGAQITGGNGVTRSRIQIDQAYEILRMGGVYAGEVQLTPVAAYRTSGDAGSASSFASFEYTLRNSTASDRSVTVTGRPDWIDVGAQSFLIPAGASIPLRLSVNIGGLPQEAAAGHVRLEAAGQSFSIPVSIQVTRQVAQAEFGPYEWTGDAAAATQNIFRIAGLRNGPPSRIEVAVGRSALGTYGSSFSDCELTVRPENYRNREYVITSTDLATCGAFGRADLSFRLTVDSQDKALGLRLRRFGVRASGALTDFAFDNVAGASPAAGLQVDVGNESTAEGPIRLLAEAPEQGEGGRTQGGDLARQSSGNPRPAAPESAGAAEFGPFEWAGDADAPTVSIFRISGVRAGAPTLIEVAVGEAYAGGFGGVYADCTLTPRSDRYSGQEYVIFNSDLAECGRFGRANLSFRITPHQSDSASDLRMRRFAVNRAGGLTDFGFDHDQEPVPSGADIGGGLRQYEFGPFEWTGDASAVATNVFRLSGVGGGQPEKIEVSIANAAQSGFSGSFADCTLPMNAQGAGAWEYVFSNADFAACGAFGRADLTFRVTLRSDQVGRLVQLRRFALWGNDLTDFGFDGQRGQGSEPQMLGDGRAAVEFGPFDWTGDRNAWTQSSFRISGLKAAPLEVRVALENAASEGFAGTFDDCQLGPSASGFSGGEYLIAGADLAGCGDYVRADLRFRVIARADDVQSVMRMRRFAITASGGITDFGFDNR